MQDGLLLLGAMIVAVLLALEYDLFSFAEQLTVPQRKITLAEAIFLTLLLAVGIFIFIIRRLREERRDLARYVATRKQLRELRSLAAQDPLTGLPNRRALLSALRSATHSPLSADSKHALFLLDLNNFKRINDRRGHACGDRILTVVAERFRTAIRPSDVLARIGGDEFAVLAYSVDQSAAFEIGRRLTGTLENDITLDGQSHEIGVSVGAALIPDDGTTAEEILHNADLAMYSAKKQGQPSPVFFASMEPARQTAKL
jgi:diguanylate cyclase (GGDEF)-like protein